MQRGVGDETVNQLVTFVNSKLEETITTQIQVQFQTSGKQALKETLWSTMETSMLPSFETSCQTMFGQTDSAFEKGMAEHTSAAQQRSEFAHSQLATNLKKELSRMISEGSYEDSFKLVLRIQDGSMISWLCAKVNLCSLVDMRPRPISQRVVLDLLSQLACDIGNDTSSKFDWMTGLIGAIIQYDRTISANGPTIFERAYSILNHHPTDTESDNSALTLLMEKLHQIIVKMKQPSFCLV